MNEETPVRANRKQPKKDLKTRRRMWEAYLAFGNVRRAALACGVDTTTVQRAIDSEGWEQRRVDLMARADAAADEKYVEWVRRRVGRIDKILDRSEEALLRSAQFDAAGHVALIKLRCLLSGQPESRSETVTTHAPENGERQESLRALLRALGPQERQQLVELFRKARTRGNGAAAGNGVDPASRHIH